MNLITFENVKKTCPLVHSITNYVTVNDCANVILACGASPIMADDEKEVEEITTICSSLVVNIGTLNERTVNSMIKAGKKANELNHPVVLDPVGVGASSFRNETAFRLLKEVRFSVIRGNISEIKFLCSGVSNTQGVDASEIDKITDDNIDSVISYLKDFSKKTGAIIAVSGAIDIVCDENNAYIIRNGNAMMSKITGTGCMLSSLIGAYIGANKDDLCSAVATAVCVMGLCGELGFKKMIENQLGTSSYKTYIIDYISVLDAKTLKDGAKIEFR